jgi:hypothetical protein
MMGDFMIGLHAVSEKQYWNVIQSQHLHTDPGDIEVVLNVLEGAIVG